MLYKYKDSYKKIAMGLLSFIPDLKDISHLQTELDWYQKDGSRFLYLWKNENGDFSGVVGFELVNKQVIVRHIALSPAERNEGVTYKILDELANLYPEAKMMGSLEIAAIITKWEQRKDGE
ncbi:N-acetyltransferase [Ligilactobacillus agilis]|uniref:N-acetyltransferase n=1 Tax=Ligilactobacillus agilis TaxID=1601 RepID=UPI003D8065F1